AARSSAPARPPPITSPAETPAFSRFSMPAAASPAENDVLAPRSIATSRSWAMLVRASSPVAATFDMAWSKSAAVFTAAPTPVRAAAPIPRNAFDTLSMSAECFSILVSAVPNAETFFSDWPTCSVSFRDPSPIFPSPSAAFPAFWTESPSRSAASAAFSSPVTHFEMSAVSPTETVRVATASPPLSSVDQVRVGVDRPVARLGDDGRAVLLGLLVLLLLLALGPAERLARPAHGESGEEPLRRELLPVGVQVPLQLGLGVVTLSDHRL